MKTRLPIFLLCVLAHFSIAGEPTGPLPPFIAEQAKGALLEFIRTHRDAFVRHNPHELATLPLKAMDEGKYSLGAFILDVPHLSYSAVAGKEGAAQILYSGTFELKRGVWTASLKQVLHGQPPLPK